jgi:hypothetical protein
MDWAGVVPAVRTYPRQQLSEGGGSAVSFFSSFRATQKKERLEAKRERYKSHPWLSRSWNKWSLGSWQIHVGGAAGGASKGTSSGGSCFRALQGMESALDVLERALEQLNGAGAWSRPWPDPKHWAGGALLLVPFAGQQTARACRRFLREKVAGLEP